MKLTRNSTLLFPQIERWFLLLFSIKKKPDRCSFQKLLFCNTLSSAYLETAEEKDIRTRTDFDAAGTSLWIQRKLGVTVDQLKNEHLLRLRGKDKYFNFVLSESVRRSVFLQGNDETSNRRHASTKIQSISVTWIVNKCRPTGLPEYIQSWLAWFGLVVKLRCANHYGCHGWL